MIPVCSSVCKCTLRSGESPTDMDLLYSKDYQMFFNNLEKGISILLRKISSQTPKNIFLVKTRRVDLPSLPSPFTQVTLEQ